MDNLSIEGAKRLVAHLLQNPTDIHDSRLSFLRSFLVSLNAELPSLESKQGEVRAVDGLASWNALLAEAGSTPVVVDAFATWCGPCKAISPTYESLAAEYQGRVIFARFDVDQAIDLAREMKISAMPTFRMFKGGIEVDSFMGADPKKLKAMIKKAAESGTDANDGAEPKPDEKTSTEATREGTQADVHEDADIGDDNAEDGDEKALLEEEALLEEKALIEELNRDAGVLPVEERDQNPEELPLGDIHAELSEADVDRMIELKQEASQLAAAQNWTAALDKYNELMAFKPSTLSLAKRAEVLLHLKRPYAAIRDCETALKENDSSAKALKTRGKAYALVGEWELAAKDLQKGNAMDYDEEAGRAETEVEARWNQIRELRLKRDAKKRDLAAAKERKERERRRKEAVRRYEEEKARETAQREFKPSQSKQDVPPEGMAGLDSLLSGLNLSSDVKEKLKKPEVREKLMTIFQELQGSTPDKAMSNVLKYISDPDVGPVVQAVMASMMGGVPGAAAGARASAGAQTNPTTDSNDVPPTTNGTSTAGTGLGDMGGFPNNLADEVD